MKRKRRHRATYPKEPVVRAAFARVLADLREKAGLTQEQVAERAANEEKIHRRPGETKTYAHVDGSHPDIKRC